MHVFDVWPSLSLYLPTSQLLHAAADEAMLLNVPAAQADTLDPLPVYPASAVQSFKESDAARLAELSGQELHVSDV